MQTKRCQLSRMQLADYDDVKSLYQNEDVCRYLGGTLTDAQFRRRFETQTSEGELYWVIRHSTDQAFMGLINYQMIADSTDIREVHGTKIIVVL